LRRHRTRKFGEIAQHKSHYAVPGHSRHRFWYQSKAHVRLRISD